MNRRRLTGVAALAAALAVVPFAAAAPSEQASLPPTNTERPVVAGSPYDTETLTLAPGEWASDDAVSYQYRWQRCGGALSNVALNKPAYASNEWEPGFQAEQAVDGSPWTYWSAGDWPPQWIEVDLKTPYPLSLIRASITQLPDGQTTHRFLARGPNPLDELKLLNTFSGFTVDQQVLEQPGPADEVQYIRIETTESPSWVAWREIEALTDCSEILATGRTYTLTAADVGSRIRGVVVASNSAGSTSAASVETATVGRLAPVNLEPPAISGTAKHRQLISATTGSWRGSMPITYSYQWQRCANGSVGCTDIPLATEPSYVVRLADAGSALRVAVTATNDVGSTTAASAATRSVPYQCIVPLLKRKTLAAARARLRAAHCRLGSVRRARSSVPRGRIVSQRPPKGTELANRGKVSVVVSIGRR
jgi:PASTA domain